MPTIPNYTSPVFGSDHYISSIIKRIDETEDRLEIVKDAFQELGLKTTNTIDTATTTIGNSSSTTNIVNIVGTLDVSGKTTLGNANVVGVTTINTSGTDTTTIGNSSSETIVSGTLDVAGVTTLGTLNTSGLFTTNILAPTTSSSCALFTNILNNNITICNQLQEGYSVSIGSATGDIILMGETIQLGSDDLSQEIKCIAPLKCDTLEHLTGSKLTLGSTANLVIIGDPIVSDVYLGGGDGSNVSVEGEFACSSFKGTDNTRNVMLFTNLTTAGINFFTKSAEATTSNTLKIGDISNNVIFQAGSLTSEQDILSSSCDSTLSTTKWVKDTTQGVVDNLLSTSNIFTQEQTFSSINTNTINSTQEVLMSNGVKASSILPSDPSGIIQLGSTDVTNNGSFSLVNTGIVSFFPKASQGDNNKTTLSFRSATTLGEIGRIARTSTSSVAYQTSSDRRLKESIVDMGQMTQTILKMKPREYVWKSSKKKDYGFIAQELFEALPHTKPDDYVEEPTDEEGNPEYYGVDYGSITPYLLKALQETITRVTQLEREILLLKNR